MNVLILDTETTGLPYTKSFNNYFPYTELDKYDKSRIVSICWYIYENGILKKKFYNIIKPENFTIDNNSYACILNKITNEIANDKGVLINNVFNELLNDLKNINIIVAHNLNFDKNILLSELYRNKRDDIINLFLSKIMYCTMENGCNITKIMFKNGNYKVPKLIELYKHFFNEEFDDAHNAEADVLACAKCYFKMINL
tara:strand:- start:1185 stop:1781 length:597 start_codon:yes stop_codon:yes gene_type:complete